MKPNRAKEILRNDILHLCFADKVAPELRVILIEAVCYLDDQMEVLKILDLCDAMPGMDKLQREKEMETIKDLIKGRKAYYQSIRKGC